MTTQPAVADPAWPSADQCEELFHAALAAGDAEGVEAALRVMLSRDMRRAVRLYDNLKTALAIRDVLNPPAAAED